MALRIAVLGRGAWGSTLSRLWQAGGHQVRCWSRRDGGEPQALLPGSDLLVSAVSMAGVEGLARRLGPVWPSGLPLLSCSKGIDLEGLCTAARLWQRHLPPVGVAVLSGPNLAEELDRGLPAASVIASASPQNHCIHVSVVATAAPVFSVSMVMWRTRIVMPVGTV